MAYSWSGGEKEHLLQSLLCWRFEFIRLKPFDVVLVTEKIKQKLAILAK